MLIQLQSSRQDCQRRLIQLLPLVSLLLLRWLALRARLSKFLKELNNSANMVATHNLVVKISLHCLRSRTMHSANRLHQHKAHSKAIKINNPKASHRHNLGLSPPHLTTSPRRITLRIPNNAMLTTTITISNMDCSKALKVNKTDLPRSNGHSLGIMAHNQTALLNSPKARHSKLNLDIQPLEKVRPVATQLQTPPLRPNNQELDKVGSLNLAIPSNHRLATTHTVTPTIRAHTMLRTLTSTRTTVLVTILEDLMALKAGFTNNIPITVWHPELRMTILRLLLLAALEHLHCMAVIPH
jgi:hypothetical protein